MASPMVGQVFINAMVFGVHGNTLRRLPDQGVTGQFIAGGFAGAVQTIICCPIELVKTRMQLQGQGQSRKKFAAAVKDRYKYENPVECMMKIYKYEGPTACFRGFNSTLIREVPSFAVYFATYFALCEQLEAASGPFSIPKLFLCGGTSGVLCWLVNYPIDVVKTRLQADGMGETKYNGIIDCFKKSYQKEGYQVLFKGFNATIIRAFPTNAATLATVTTFMQIVQPEMLQEFFKPSDNYNYEHVQPGWTI